MDLNSVLEMPAAVVSIATAAKTAEWARIPTPGIIGLGPRVYSRTVPEIEEDG